ncbi:MAG: 2Fe-2S iron-sulfur cluster-binding protein [Alphaproteobacteria bacterium]
MLDQLISVIAILFLLATTAYVAVLLVGHARGAAAMERTAAAEVALLRANVDLVMERRRLEARRTEGSWNGFRKLQIARKQQEGGGICSFYLQPHDRKPLPPFRPGQYLTFQLHVPGQPKPVIRCYSLSDSPNNPDYYRVSIKKLTPPRDKPDAPPGLSSSFFHDRLDEGDIVDVKAPGGHFFLDTTKSRPVVLIGGGIGLTPVLSMLNAICESGAKRETWLFYGCRNGADHIMRDHFDRIRKEHDNVRLHICYSDPRPDKDVAGRDYDHGGRVTVDLCKSLLPSSNYEYYLCGPPPFMESLVGGLEAWGVPEADIRFEAFGPATVKRTPTVQHATAEAAAMSGLEVTFAKSGKSLAWSAASASLLDFAEEHGVAIDFGCRAGNCGTCLTAIKAGEVSYVNPPGASPEAGSCLTCISVPKTNLTLDA